MARVFVSYSRDIADVAKTIVADLEALGHDVWFDQALSGGQAWWAQILQRIREADAVVFLAAPSSLASVACRSEWQYALGCGRTVVPVLVAEGVSMNLLPPALAALQVVDHRSHDRAAALRLARALSSVPPAAPLPEPLPTPPSAPMSYLGDIAARIDGAEPLSFEAQSSMLVELRPGLKDPALRDDTRVVLQKLRRRRDAFASVASEIDEALAASAPMPPPAAAPVAPAPSAQPPIVVAPPAALAQASAVTGRWKMAGLCAAAPLPLSVLLGELMGTHAMGDFFASGAIGSVGAAIAGAMAGYSRRALWQLATAAAVGWIVWVMLNPLDVSSERDRITTATAFGLSAGAILMGAQLIWLRRRQRTSAAGPAASSA